MSRDQTYRYVILAWTVLLWLVATFVHLDYVAVLFGLLSGFFAVCNVILDAIRAGSTGDKG